MLAAETSTQGAAADLNALPGRIIDAAHLGPDVHRFVELPGGQRIAAVEKHSGQALGQVGDAVIVTFKADDTILVVEKSD